MSRSRVAFIGVSRHSYLVECDMPLSGLYAHKDPKNVTILPDMDREQLDALAGCYTSYHPDAKMWLPSGTEHPFNSMWARFDPHDIYYVGGFGE